MLEVIKDKPFLVAIVAGSLAQAIKVLTFLLLEKRVNYRRFVQTDGSPNMHSTAMTALTIAVGLNDGFGSLLFGLSLCLSVIIMVDTMNVKNAASRQAEVIVLVLERLRKRRAGRIAQGGGWVSNNDQTVSVSYTLLDVVLGIGLGVIFTLIIY